MTAPVYTVPMATNVTTVAATPKTVVGVVGTNVGYGLQLKGYEIGFRGVTASNVPVTVDVCRISTLGTSTAVTPVREGGRLITAGVASFTAGENHTVEPTGLEVLRSFPLTPNGGAVLYDYPLGDEPDCDEQDGFCLRVTDPTGASALVRGGLRVTRI